MRIRTASPVYSLFKATVKCISFTRFSCILARGGQNVLAI